MPQIAAITEHYAKLGASGAEKIRGILNQSFTIQGDMIAAYGGNVIRYCGDGLLAIWPEREGDKPEYVALRTAQCSMQMQEKLKNFEPVPGLMLTVSCALIALFLMIFEAGASDVHLINHCIFIHQLHIGMGFGETVIMFVGNHLGWDCTVGGEPLKQIATACEDARPG